MSRWKRGVALTMVLAAATAAQRSSSVAKPLTAAACGTSVDGQCVPSLLVNTEQHALGVTGDQLKAYLLSKDNPLDTLAASRMINRVPLSARQQAPYSFYTEVTGSWTGFIANESNTSHQVNEVHAEYPAHNSGGPLGAWTGIGGYNTTNLIQSGIDDSNLKVWYEILPNPAYYMFTVSDGDLIFSDQGYDGDTQAWSIIVEDLTTGQYFGDEFSVSVDQSTAEWVMEIPGNNSVPSHVSTQFEQAEWWDEGWSNQAVNSGENSQTIRASQSNMRASDLGQDGKSFSVQ